MTKRRLVVAILLFTILIGAMLWLASLDTEQPVEEIRVPVALPTAD